MEASDLPTFRMAIVQVRSYAQGSIKVIMQEGVAFSLANAGQRTNDWVYVPELGTDVNGLGVKEYSGLCSAWDFHDEVLDVGLSSDEAWTLSSRRFYAGRGPNQEQVKRRTLHLTSHFSTKAHF